MFGSRPMGAAPFGFQGSSFQVERYEIPATDTPEGQARLQAYFRALGEFVDMFSRAEVSCHFVLRHYGGMSSKVGKALLSGVRSEATRSLLTRLKDIGVMAEEAWSDVDPTLEQLNKINDCRNLILHYGADQIAEGQGSVTDSLIALTPERTRSFAISPEILADLTADLKKIIIHLRARHSGITDAMPQILLDGIDVALREPWRYKPPPSLHPKSQKSGRKDRPSS